LKQGIDESGREKMLEDETLGRTGGKEKEEGGLINKERCKGGGDEGDTRQS